MATETKPEPEPLHWKQSLLWLALALASFHAAYTSLKYPAAGLLIFGYAYGLIRLTDQPTMRRAFYFGLATGVLCYAPQLGFFWRIFGPAAVVLWLILAFWIGLFAAIVCGSFRRWGKTRGAWLIPIVWTGIEYFRSELYYLKFSWLNVGYVFPDWEISFQKLCGMYGHGFLIFAATTFIVSYCNIKRVLREWIMVCFILVVGLAFFAQLSAALQYKQVVKIDLVGIQMEFPSSGVLTKALDKALAKNTNAAIFVLSEYTLDGGVPESLKNWCRAHERFLVVGGKEFVTNDIYYNTAFVVGTNGDIVFQQAKSVPIQFFKDGLPATNQAVWNSPWGKIGICICYDLSYTRVTDELVRQGAQLLIVPTMDVEDWGRHQHELHSRVAPVRAAEYGVPIFRVASSGISQAINGSGQVVAQTTIPGSGEIFSAQLRLPRQGSLPLDRWLAPLCTGITALLTAVLLGLTWRDKMRAPKA